MCLLGKIFVSQLEEMVGFRKRESLVQHPPENVRAFFARSDYLDRMVLRPLSHITLSWETRWDSINNHYAPEPDSYAADLNWLIEQIASCPKPTRYHDNEDTIVRMLDEADWPEQEPNGYWITLDYAHLLERGSWGDIDQQHLICSAAGRVQAALDRGQFHFDVMEVRHLKMLAAVMTIAIYHRDNDGNSLRLALEEDTA